MHGVVGVLVNIDVVAGCLLEGSVEACLSVNGDADLLLCDPRGILCPLNGARW